MAISDLEGSSLSADIWGHVQPAVHDRNCTPRNVHGLYDSTSLLSVPKQQACSPHVDTLLDAPREIRIPFRSQGREERDGRCGRASGGGVLNGGVKRGEHTGVQRRVGRVSTIHVNPVGTD